MPTAEVRPQSTVIVVDDEDWVRDYLSNVLKLEGYDTRCFSESLSALAYVLGNGGPADLMLADINMPGMDGIELLREVKSARPKLPVVIVSGLYELALALEAVNTGADDYLRKPVSPTDISTVVGKYLHNDVSRQEELVRRALRQFLAARDSQGGAGEHLRKVFESLGFKRYETFQHSQRVAAYCRLFGEKRGLSPAALDHLELGALLHDVGKIGIPRNVLLKPGPLNDDEWTVMRTHPSVGYGIMSRFPELNREAEVVHGHHERFDGGGYPQGLVGSKIPLWARMFSIVDTLDAMTSDRPYRAALGFDTALAEVRRQRGSQFDPELVDLFLELPAENLREIRAKFPDLSGEDADVPRD